MAALIKPHILYVVDTIALTRYFEDNLPPAADKFFQQAEDGEALLLIPSIVIGEFIYTALKGRLRHADPRALILELLDDLEASPHMNTVDTSTGDWRQFLQLRTPELHDRMICAIAINRKTQAIISNDPEITQTTTTIWS